MAEIHYRERDLSLLQPSLECTRALEEAFQLRTGSAPIFLSLRHSALRALDEFQEIVDLRRTPQLFLDNIERLRCVEFCGKQKAKRVSDTPNLVIAESTSSETKRILTVTHRMISNSSLVGQRVFHDY